MKYLLVFAVMLLSSCGTIGGAISGAGDDDVSSVDDIVEIERDEE